VIRGAAASPHALRPALIELCEERGFERLTVESICDRAGISRAQFGRRYADVEECFCAVLDELRGEFTIEVLGSVLAESRWRDQIRAAAYAMLAFWSADLPRARFMLVAAFAAGERASMIRDEGMEAMVELIDLGRAEPEAPATLTRATAEAMAGTVYSQMQRLVVVERSPAEYRAMVPQLLHTVVLPYLGGEAAAEELEIAPPRVEAPPPPPPGPTVPEHR
jgi:AcrR family transcriptional regulator